MTTKQRDMTPDAFRAALSARGWSPAPLGYVEMTLPAGNTISINRGNGGLTRRAQLAYLIREARKHGIES